MKTLFIKTERIKRGWTLDYVAQQIKVTNQAIQQIEIGKRKPSYYVLCKLEDLFKLTHRQLFSIVEDKSINAPCINPS